MMGREQECEPSSASPQIRWQPGPGGVACEEDAGGKGNEGWSQGRQEEWWHGCAVRQVSQVGDERGEWGEWGEWESEKKGLGG